MTIHELIYEIYLCICIVIFGRCPHCRKPLPPPFNSPNQENADLDHMMNCLFEKVRKDRSRQW